MRPDQPDKVNYDPDGSAWYNFWGSGLNLATGAGDDQVVIERTAKMKSKMVPLLDRNLSVETGDGDDVVTDLSNHSSIRSSPFAPLTAAGGAGNDTLVGGPGKDCLLGENGDDLLEGGAGDDFLDGGDGTNTVWAGGGNDTLVRNSQHDVLHWGDPPAPHSAPPVPIDHANETDDVPSVTTNDGGNVLDDNSVIPKDGGDLSDSPAPGDVLLIGQGIAMDGQDEGGSASLDTAGADAESRPLADTTPDDDPGADVFGFADDAELASDTDANSANLSDDFSLGLNAALSNAFLASLRESSPG